MRVCKVCMVLGVALAMASPALAQRGRGGFGMFGGGGPRALLSNKGVQTELKLTEDQIKKSEALVKEVADKHKAESDEIAKLDRQEQFPKRAELMQTENAEITKGLSDVMNPDQLKRFKQIELQVRGTQAFSDPAVQTELKLTDDQKEKIKTIQEDFRNDMRDFFQNSRDLSQEERTKKMTAMRKEVSDKVKGLLTDDQKKTWSEMVGASFDFKPEFTGRGGRGRRNGGG